MAKVENKLQKNKNNKMDNQIIGEEKNIKTASTTYNVNDYDGLEGALSDNQLFDDVTVNIQSDIQLQDTITVSGDIKTLTINGNQKTIDGQYTHQFLYINAMNNISINNLTITNCNSDENGGAICNENGDLTITQCTLTNNHAESSGGAIYNENGILFINNSTLTDNNATWAGAIDNYEGTLTVSNTMLINNNASEDGGAIENEYGNIIINNSTLTNNKAEWYGGAIDNSGTLTINNSQLTNNIATDGGAIENVFGNLTMDDTLLTNNIASENGGAIDNTEANLTLGNITLSNNQAEYGGGAIYNYEGNLNICNSVLEYNNATIGAAINNNQSYAIILSNYFIANKAQMTGNAIIDDAAAVIEDNEGDRTSGCSSTIYTNSSQDVLIKDNKFYDKLNTKINISSNNTNISVNDVITLTFTLNDQLNRTLADKNITILINDHSTNKTTDENGTTTMEYTIQSNETPVNATYTDPTEKYNATTTTVVIKIASPTLTVDEITAAVGETINITARITSGGDTLNDINKGKVSFKVNGKTLKDSDGKVIYAKVVNGTAKIENYIVPEDWAKEDTSIEAIYSGSTSCEKLISEKVNITLSKPTARLTTENITASAGDSVTLKATITDGDKIINRGKVVFKINGKTVKDANSRVIYAKVNNGIAIIEYTLPADMKSKEYNITAVLTSSDYDKLEDTKTLIITS